MSKVIAIIGGGAAGFFCAAELKHRCPDADVTIYEAQSRPMAKLAITGGGRCNLTNTFERIGSLKEAYPRGERLIRAAFGMFSPERTLDWWESEGVKTVCQADGCVFPQSQDAMEVVGRLAQICREEGVKVMCSHRVEAISRGEKFEIKIKGRAAVFADIVVVTTGGGALSMLDELREIKQERLAPSLFTLKIGDEGLNALMGTVVEDATLSLAGTKFRSRGTLLITDWGVSGPATLKLSSYAAYYLKDNGYKTHLIINYLSTDEESVRRELGQTSESQPKKQVANTPVRGITSRLWSYLLKRSGIREDIRWAELGSKGLNRLVNTIVSDDYAINGRCRFKEEFVTAGGVSSSEVNPQTLESKHFPGLYFAGEVLDIDAITGGFNLQAAWSTAFVVAKAIGDKE